MTRPLLIVKFRGTGQTECEVFQDVGGNLTSLFTYGTAGRQTDVDFKPGGLCAHWCGALYAIEPELGIWKNTPPSDTAVLLHTFTSPSTGSSSYCMDWQTVFKDGKTQLFMIFKGGTASTLRMVFIDEEDNVTETAEISDGSPPINMAHMRGLNFGNKIYTSQQATGSLQLLVVDPVSESVSKITWHGAGANYEQSDIAIHNGKLYGYTQQATTTVGLGNALWNLSAAIPYEYLEWEGYQATSNEFPSDIGQCLIFSDGDDLMMLGYGSGTTLEEIDLWKVNFDSNDTPIGITSVIDQTLGFNLLVDNETSRYWVSRDIEEESGQINTNLYIVTGPGSTEGNPIHHYKWNGVNAPCTYLGFGADSFSFDCPTWKIGGGLRTYGNAAELDFVITNTAATGANMDITYLITGSANPSGVGMCVKYNNLKDSPLVPATVTPTLNGTLVNGFITGLSTGESGIFRWNLPADRIDPGDIPNLSAFLIRT